MEQKRLKEMFTYHRPTTPEVDRMSIIRNLGKELAEVIRQAVPLTDIQDRAIDAVHQATMLANYGIVMSRVLLVKREFDGTGREPTDADLDATVEDAGRYPGICIEKKQDVLVSPHQFDAKNYNRQLSTTDVEREQKKLYLGDRLGGIDDYPKAVERAKDPSVGTLSRSLVETTDHTQIESLRLKVERSGKDRRIAFDRRKCPSRRDEIKAADREGLVLSRRRTRRRNELDRRNQGERRGPI